MMLCDKCGKELPESINVCASCKSSIPPFHDTNILSAQKTNTMAIASLIVGIVGFLIGFGIVAVILGIIGQNQIKASLGRQKGSGLAIAGIVIGCLGIVVFFVQIVLGLHFLPIINNLEH